MITLGYEKTRYQLTFVLLIPFYLFFPACQCYGHADECLYDAAVDAAKGSIDIHGQYEGGGVCQNCRHNTMGNNCNKCRPGYYRSVVGLVSNFG